MKKERFVFSAFVIASMFISLLAAPLSGSNIVIAESLTVSPPNGVWPDGNIMDKTPTYKWTAISGATQYQLQVYRGTTKVIDRTFASTYCGAAECTVTPSNTLTYAGHTWKVRAYKDSAWTEFSSSRTFSVDSPGFVSPFNSSSTGWSAPAPAITRPLASPGTRTVLFMMAITAISIFRSRLKDLVVPIVQPV
jgi:hypothetical protein